MPQPLSLPELAAEALAAPPLARACWLAAWIGDGRELTGTGVLRPADALKACAALGIELPPGTSRLRSARDVGELHQAWEMAVAAGLVTVTASQVRAAPDAPGLAGAAGAVAAAGAAGPITPELSERIVTAWLRAAALPMGVPDEPCMICLAVLHELVQVGGPADMPGLVRAGVDAVRQLGSIGFLPDDPGETCPGCGEVHPPDRLAGLLGGLAAGSEIDAADHARSSVAALVRSGAAVTGPGTVAGGTVSLSALGGILADRIMAGLEPDPAASAADAAQQVSILPERLAEAAIRPWLAARPPDAAVRQLLDAAAHGGPLTRGAALTLARKQGLYGRAAWREQAREPGFGAYARQWLISQGEPVVADDRDDAWLLVDSITQAGTAAPEEVISAVLGSALVSGPDEETDDLLTLIERCGHPAARAVAILMREAARWGLPEIRLPCQACSLDMFCALGKVSGVIQYLIHA